MGNYRIIFDWTQKDRIQHIFGKTKTEAINELKNFMNAKESEIKIKRVIELK